MKLPSKVRKALNEFVEACKEKFGKDLVSVVLFGSRVKGYTREDSDFDVLVVVKNLPDVKERFLLGYKVLFGQKNWKNYLEYVKKWVEVLNPVYIEGGRQWNIKSLIKSWQKSFY